MNDIERYNFWNLELAEEVKKSQVIKIQDKEQKTKVDTHKYTEVFHLDIQSHLD